MPLLFTETTIHYYMTVIRLYIVLYIFKTNLKYSMTVNSYIIPSLPGTVINLL